MEIEIIRMKFSVFCLSLDSIIKSFVKNLKKEENRRMEWRIINAANLRRGKEAEKRIDMKIREEDRKREQRINEEIKMMERRTETEEMKMNRIEINKEAKRRSNMDYREKRKMMKNILRRREEIKREREGILKRNEEEKLKREEDEKIEREEEDRRKKKVEEYEKARITVHNLIGMC